MADDDNRKLSGAEERERLKQVYLKELRLRKQFLKKMRSGRQLSRVANEMEKLVGMQQDDTDDWIRKLEQGTAVDEAKLEIALEKMRMTDLKDTSGTAELGETDAEPTNSTQAASEAQPQKPLSKAAQAKAALQQFMQDEGLAEDTPEQKKTLGAGLEEDSPKKTIGINIDAETSGSDETQDPTEPNSTDYTPNNDNHAL